MKVRMTVKRHMPCSRRLMVLSAFLALFGGVGEAASLSLTASTTTPNVGQTFTVTINIQSAPPFAFWGDVLRFDNNFLELTGQAAGSYGTFVPDTRGFSAFNAGGEVRTGGYAFSNNTGGNGTLGVFTFKALRAGTTQITTVNKAAGEPFGAVLRPLAGGDVPPAIAGPLTIVIGGTSTVPVKSDFDGDRKADILLRHPSNGGVYLWLMK